MAGELILIVDGKDIIRSQAEVALLRFNYRTLAARDAQQALKIIGQTPPDILLSDLHLPGMDGLQLFEAARRLQPELVVVLVAAPDSAGTVLKALPLGINGFLPEPFSDSELERTIQNAWHHQRTLLEALRGRA